MTENEENNKWIKWIPIGISVTALGVSFISTFISYLSLELSKQRNKITLEQLTSNAITEFDGNWIGGTFPCIKYLKQLPEREKVDAYLRKEHSALIDSRDALTSCIPQHENAIKSLTPKESNTSEINIPTYMASEVNEKVRRSLNSLNKLTSELEKLDSCTVWAEIDDPLNFVIESKIIKDWNDHADCGDCFPSIKQFRDQNLSPKFNQQCST